MILLSGSSHKNLKLISLRAKRGSLLVKEEIASPLLGFAMTQRSTVRSVIMGAAQRELPNPRQVGKCGAFVPQMGLEARFSLTKPPTRLAR